MLATAPKPSAFHNCLCFPLKVLPRIGPRDLIGDFLGIRNFALAEEEEVSSLPQLFPGDDLLLLGDTFLENGREDLDWPLATGEAIGRRLRDVPEISMTGAAFSLGESSFENSLFPDL
jgi:hypothetical protein